MDIAVLTSFSNPPPHQVFMAFWIVFSVTGGLVYYHAENANPLLLVGLVCMIAGVVLFQQHDREKARCAALAARADLLAPFGGTEELEVDEASKERAASRRRPKGGSTQF